MPTFPIKSTKQLADFLYPVTEQMATEIIALADKANDGMAYVAVYYWSHNHKRLSMALTVTLQFDDDLFAYVHTSDYHPRKDGKADLIFKSDYVAKF